MNTQNTQVDMSPEEAFASLGLATRLNEDMLMSQHPQGEKIAPTSPENAPGQEKTPKVEDTRMPELEAKLDKSISEIRDEIKATVREEISGIRKEIEKIINEED